MPIKRASIMPEQPALGRAQTHYRDTGEIWMAWSLSQGGGEGNATKLSDKNVYATKISDRPNAVHTGCKLAHAVALLGGAACHPIYEAS
jgi:hypothetical protein